jgi:hypothetical protein
MHISELHIFQKDTDATEALRGFKYQELKTLESWLINRVEAKDELIYCDFEEDIFQRNLNDYKSKFRQIKLYNSKNFSFSSEEIQKAIGHFFMLYSKGEYLLDEIKFTFETNADIARRYNGNDADLLREWSENQTELEGELLNRVSVKLKAIVLEYLDRSIASENDKTIKESKKQKRQELESEGEEIWETFSMTIQWDFLDITAEEEVSECTSRIFDLIGQLPYPINKEDYNIVFSSLLREVGERSIELVGENRVLSNELINDILLNLGDTADKRYNQIYKEWKEISSIQSFLVGEFYEVISGVNHCARSKYLEQHTTHWICLIEQYINSSDTPAMFKCDALYQYIWLKMRTRFGPNPMNSIKGEESRVKEFFEHSFSFDRTIDFEHILNILNLLLPAVKMSNLDIDDSQVQEWETRFEEKLTNEISTSTSYNKKCALYEIKAFFDFYKGLRFPGNNNLDKIKESFDEIIELLPNAKLFSVSQLSRRIDSIVEILIAVPNESNEVEIFENFGNQLLPIVGEREGDFSIAKRYSQKGISFLNSKKPDNVLKALDYLHKSKNLWYKDETMEGFFLALLNISQLYLAIGMYSAAKYYAMSAAWYSMSQDNPDHYKRASQAMGLVIHADLLQGAWIGVLDDFKVFAWSWQQFSSQETDATENEDFWKPIFDTATVLIESGQRSPQVSGLFEHYKNGSVKEFYDQFIEPIKADLAKRIEDTGGLNNQLVRPPLMDLGETREIDWKCFGSHWRILFKNDYENTAVAEDFVAVLQILLAEIALSKKDLYLVPNEVVINLNIAENIDIKQETESQRLEWNVSLKSVEYRSVDELHRHNTTLTATIWSVINEISLVPEKELQEYLGSRMKDHELISKLFILTSYQNCFRDLIVEAEFNEKQRNNFSHYTESLDYKENRAFSSDSLISNRYNQEKSLELIRNRYNNADKLTGITLERIREDSEFKSLYSQLKSEGWLDWQILMALTNSVINVKAKYKLRMISPKDPKYDELFRKEMFELSKVAEKENYLEIPIKELIEGVKFQLKITAIQVLRNFDLQSKMRMYIGTDKLREMLNDKFNFNVDDTPELSPFN